MGKVNKRIAAKDTGIEWLDHNCPDKPFAPFAHHLVAKVNASAGTIYICKYCGKAKWLPNSMSECRQLDYYQRQFGMDEGYCKLLDEHPMVRNILGAMNGVQQQAQGNRKHTEQSRSKGVHQVPAV